ncbi:MAG: sensor histidine kinase [Bacillota bacterium]|nr:MAG: sensor histidine kinase [Bacillota bacterium]
MGLRGKLFASHFLLTLAVVLLIGLVTLGRVRGFIIQSARVTLEGQARQVSQAAGRAFFLADERQSTAFGGGLASAGLARLVSQLAAADFLVVDAGGRILVGSDRLGLLVGVVLEDGIVNRALREGETVSDTKRDQLGRLSVIAVAPVMGPQEAVVGAVALVRPVREVTQATQRFFVLVVQGLLLGVGLSLALSVFLARGLTRSLTALEAATSKIASGDFDHRVPVEDDDEIGRVAHAFNTMTQRLGDLERERQDLYASVSHELRTPVTSIKGFAQALQDNVGGPEERHRHTSIILEEASRLERLVADLFQLARLETGQVDFEWRTLDLAALVAGTAAKHRPRAQERGIELVLEPCSDEAGELPVRGDPDRLAQVLTNLVDNALRFTPAAGRITVGARRAGPSDMPGGPPAVPAARPEAREMALVTVGDTGPGIPEDDLDRVFERFYTVDRSRARERGGTGLGLAIAREIVEAHGGRIWASRGSGGGALVAFTVPIEHSRQDVGGGHQ